MELELRICRIGNERRWNWVEFFEGELLPLHERIGVGKVLGQFLSFRDDETFVWLHGFRDREERLASRDRLWNDDSCKALMAAAPPMQQEIVRNLVPALGSTINNPDGFAGIEEWPVLEIRQYRIAPGKRLRFAEFVRDRVLEPHARAGMPIYGQFDSLDDENLFVFLRAFPSLLERDQKKAEFYQSRRWLEEMQDEAFSMIEDYSNVLLVTPI
jgi:hypothetical protein